MNKLLLIILLAFFSCAGKQTEKIDVIKVSEPDASNYSDTCVDFNSLNTKIRDGLISKEDALKQVQILLPKLKNFFYNNGGMDYPKNDWVFPVQGYSKQSIGGTNGSGYIEGGYDYFDGNKHKGHPAQDIFISDRNHDCLDIKTKKPVNILSMTSGIVIATENVWDTTSNLRGGKYIWIYEPFSNSFFYYAHNSNVFVKPCDIIKPGDTIAEVGRTGLNAFKKRSPTHLHLMQLQLDSNNYPRPFNCYSSLILTSINSK